MWPQALKPGGQLLALVSYGGEAFLLLFLSTLPVRGGKQVGRVSLAHSAVMGGEAGGHTPHSHNAARGGNRSSSQ